MGSKKKFALFVDHDFFGVLNLNGIVAGLIGQGYTPVIFNGKNGRNRTPKVPHPEISKLFNNHILDRVILPFIEKQNPDHLKNLSPKQLAEKHNLDYFEIDDPNDSEDFKNLIMQDDFTGALSQRFSQVFGEDIVSLVKQRGIFWNMHSGLVPDYKGLLTLYPAIENGATHYGMTLHEMAPLLDNGDIIGQTELPLDHRNKTIFQLYLDTVQGGIDMVLKNTKLLIEGGCVPKRKQGGDYKAGYYTNPTIEQFRRAAQKGVVYADTSHTPELMAGSFATGRTQSALGREIKCFIRPLETLVVSNNQHRLPYKKNTTGFSRVKNFLSFG